MSLVKSADKETHEAFYRRSAQLGYWILGTRHWYIPTLDSISAESDDNHKEQNTIASVSYALYCLPLMMNITTLVSE